MSIDDRFEELAASLAGFYRTWVVYLGLELGLFAHLRSAGHEGSTVAGLAEMAGCRLDPVDAWTRAAHACEIAEIDGERVRIDEEVAAILLDDRRPEYLGGQFVSTIVASLDYTGMAEFFRTGEPVARPARYREAIERLTVQDIAVFFEEALAALPDLVADLARGGRVLDVHCGGGRWLIAMARRFSALELVGVEFERDSAERAIANVAEAGLGDRIRIETREILGMGHVGEFDVAYLQYALHQLTDPVGSLRAAWSALRPDGRLLVLEWCLPSSLDEYRTPMGELLWGTHLDELYQGSRLYTREGFEAIFRDADLPGPLVVDLPSGATLFLARRGD